MKSIQWKDTTLILLDQTRLPIEEIYIHCTDWRQVAEAIKVLRVRGAPAIGVAAAYGLVLAAREACDKENTIAGISRLWQEFAQQLKETRPTAVNLAWAVEKILALGLPKLASLGNGTNLSKDGQKAWQEFLLTEAKAVDAEDMALNQAMAKAGATLFEGQKNIRILTHCNAGALATAGYGTALGVVRELYAKGQLERVYADETRPLLQGSRLTAFELHAEGIPVTLLTDNMAAYAMQQGLVDAVIVGADRITLEGDVANKIGTYGVALLAKAHRIPFYVAAPYSTFDFTIRKGREIPIEMREPDEVRHFYGVQTAPADIEVLNPAFDVTPHELVTAIITEKGVLRPDYYTSIMNFKEKSTL